MVKFSKWAELQRAKAELSEKTAEVDALIALEHEENQAIIMPLAGILESMTLVNSIKREIGRWYYVEKQ